MKAIHNNKGGLDIGHLGALKNMSVVCISHGFQKNYERGFCNGLAVNGAIVTLICSDQTDFGGLNPAVHTVNLRGSQEEKRPTWKKVLNLLSYHFQLMQYLLSHRPSVAHVIGLIPSPIIYGVLEGFLMRIIANKYVLTVHNILPHDRHSQFNRVAYGWAFKMPHHLVVHTLKVKNNLVHNYGVPSERITVMEHGIEPTTKSMYWGEAKDKDSDPVILAFGNMAPYKGVDLLIEALKNVEFPFLLVIAGVCPDITYRNKLKALIESHPFKTKIEWRDYFIEEKDMEQLFKTADLLALPYRHIDQSGVLFQALRFGVPVLATRVGQFDEYVGAEIGELANPEDVADITAALIRWENRRHEFSRQSIRDYGLKFEWTSTVLALNEAYN